MAASATLAAKKKRAQSKAQRTERKCTEAHFWIDGVKRNPAHFNIPDPVDRFRMVNSHLGVGVADLHFQSCETVVSILKRLFWDTPLSQEIWGGLPQLWIITGTGRHNAATGGNKSTLFDFVGEYLDTCGYEFKVGRDGAGNKGAYLVQRPKQK